MKTKLLGAASIIALAAWAGSAHAQTHLFPYSTDPTRYCVGSICGTIAQFQQGQEKACEEHQQFMKKYIHGPRDADRWYNFDHIPDDPEKAQRKTAMDKCLDALHRVSDAENQAWEIVKKTLPPLPVQAPVQQQALDLQRRQTEALEYQNRMFKAQHNQQVLSCMQRNLGNNNFWACGEIWQ
jgi:hypothetical protein